MKFHALKVKEVRRETPDCVSVSFDIPEELRNIFQFHAGQSITVKFDRAGEELRRSYSICSSPPEQELRIAVKKIPEGIFSSHANQQLQAGDIIEVLPPVGKFGYTGERSAGGNYLAFAAGSGITPVISIIKELLANDDESQVTLVYGNRDQNNIIFREQLQALKNKYMSRLAVHHILSRETTDAPVNSGRIGASKCEELSQALIEPDVADHIFICGPSQMIFEVRDWLLAQGISEKRIHFELFTVPGQTTSVVMNTVKENTERSSRVTIRLDGRSLEFDLPFEGRSILDSALKLGADLPFACKGGVCATCKAKLTDGQVEMDRNFALESEELAEGYILTCQSHPRTDRVTVDFDAR